MSRFFRELLTPSPEDEGPADFAAYALGHAVIGAAAASILGPWAWAFVAVYGALKEGWDIWHGGSVWDSATDIFFVALGVMTGPVVWIVTATSAAILKEAFTNGQA